VRTPGSHLFIELPDDEEIVEQMAQVVQEADDAYSRFIVQQWGYEWLGIALVDETAYAFLKKADPTSIDSADGA
jgi:hypothetical protein